MFGDIERNRKEIENHEKNPTHMKIIERKKNWSLSKQIIEDMAIIFCRKKFFVEKKIVQNFDRKF